MSDCPHGMTSKLWCDECKAEADKPAIKKAPLPTSSKQDDDKRFINKVVRAYRPNGAACNVVNARFEGKCPSCHTTIGIGDVIFAERVNHPSPQPKKSGPWICGTCFIRDGGTVDVIGDLP